MNRIIKKCLKQLLNQPLVNLSPFGYVIASTLCPINKMCLRLGENCITILLAPEKSTEKYFAKAYWLIAELVSVLEKLEKENLIYVCQQSVREELICYEDALNIGKEYEYDEEKLQILKNGICILDGQCFDNDLLLKSLQRYLTAFIVPTSGLRDFVNHHYLIDVDYNNWRALKLSKLSIIVAIFSIFAATFISNCFGYSTIDETQFNRLIFEIRKKNSIANLRNRKTFKTQKNNSYVHGTKVVPRK